MGDIAVEEPPPHPPLPVLRNLRGGVPSSPLESSPPPEDGLFEAADAWLDAEAVAGDAVVVPPLTSEIGRTTPLLKNQA